MNTAAAAKHPPDYTQQMASQPVLPLVMPDNGDIAVAVADALAAGGLYAMEVPLAGGGEAAIRAIARHVPHMLVGAGMVATPADIERAAHAGAGFVTTPGTTVGTLAAARAQQMPVLPGATTFSEVMTALEGGVELVRLLPADLTGSTAWGVNWLRAAQAVLPTARFSVAGGINLRNAHEFLVLPNVMSVTGTWVVPHSFVTASNWRGVAELAHEALLLGRHRAR